MSLLLISKNVRKIQMRRARGASFSRHDSRARISSSISMPVDGGVMRQDSMSEISETTPASSTSDV